MENVRENKKDSQVKKTRSLSVEAQNELKDC